MEPSQVSREWLEAEARRLPSDERARLVEALLQSLEDEAEIASAWRAEIRRRMEDLDSGTVKTVPADQVFAEVDDLLAE